MPKHRQQQWLGWAEGALQFPRSLVTAGVFPGRAVVPAGTHAHLLGITDLGEEGHELHGLCEEGAADSLDRKSVV